MRLAVLLLVALAASPTWGQDAEANRHAEVERLLGILDNADENQAARGDAWDNLVSIANDYPPVVLTIARCLEERHAVSLWAVLALKQIGVRAEPALPTLLDALRDQDLYTAKGKIKIDVGNLSRMTAQRLAVR